MYLKVLTIFAAAILFTACSSSQPDTVGRTQVGGNNSDRSSDRSTAGRDGVSIGDLDPRTDAYIEQKYGYVYFGYDSIDLVPQARTVVEGWAEYAGDFPQMVFSVEGHADERGTREYNLALGERRANSIKEYLTALGVAPNRISTVTYGKERPVAVGSIEESYAKNRRGVLRPR